jgi:hypothetical protein
MATEAAEEGSASATDEVAPDVSAVGEARGTIEGDGVAGADRAGKTAEGKEPGEAAGDDEAAREDEPVGCGEAYASHDGDEAAAELDDADGDGESDGESGEPTRDEGDPPEEYADDDPDGLDDQAGPVQRARRWPRVLLAGGIAVLAAAIVGGGIAIVGSVTHGFKKPVKVTYKKAAVFSLKTGDCIDPQGQDYTLIPCDTPHQAEVFATFALAGKQYPGNSAIAATAGQGCASRLTGYLNPQLAVSLASTYVYPDATAWKAGTRTVICEVQASSGQLTGSVRGASATAA